MIEQILMTIMLTIIALCIILIAWAVVRIKDTPPPGMTEDEIKHKIAMKVNK
jgi:hypothetical protein